jgi:ABC-type multidrug transport system fused ATPase/permease subunit
MSRRFDTLQSTMAGGERILELLNTPIDVQDAENAKEMESIVGGVRFENVPSIIPMTRLLSSIKLIWM